MSSAAPSTTAPWDVKRKRTLGAMIRQLLFWAVILGLLGLVASGLKPQPIEVETSQVKRGPLTLRIVEEGRTRVKHRYVIATPVAGQMARVSLRAGDVLKAGETVITSIEPTLPALLDPRGRAQAEAQVQAASAGLQRAQESVSMAVTAEKFAKQSWERIARLADARMISETDRDNTQRDAELRAREVKAAEFAVKIASYELEQAKAALLAWDSPAGANPKPSPLAVKSPISGVVLKVMQESATVVTPGTAIMEVGDAQDLEIEAEILSRDAVGIPANAEVIIDQWGGPEPLKGRVRRVEPAAFTKISALGVEEQRVLVLTDLVDPPASAKALGDRFRVEVRIATWHSDSVLLVPSGALFREGSDWKAYVLRDGKAVAVKLRIAHTDGLHAELLEGLSEGDEVLLHPPDTVKDGAEVKAR